ncbi:MAG TPA: hypothetical protein VF092_12505 [Longimicrobium sp.]
MIGREKYVPPPRGTRINPPMRTWAICLRSGDNPASLERRKLYEVVPDPVAERSGFVRIVDESGEDYLHPRSSFHLVDLPGKVDAVLRQSP